MRSVLCGLLLALATVSLTACHSNLYLAYKFPTYTFADRPIPPSKLAQRVMIAYGNAGLLGASGALAIVDAKRDIRNNIQDTTSNFSISGYATAMPTRIYSFPEQIRGYVYSSADGSLFNIDYGTEASAGSVGTFTGSSSNAVPTDFGRFFAAQGPAGQLSILDNTSSKGYSLNLPNVYQVFTNTADTIAIAMVRNSDTLYQVVKLNSNQYIDLAHAAAPPNIVNGSNQGGINATDCQPVNLPVYCVVPVAGKYDRPIGAFFSSDGSTAYILNCGPECGGTTASVTAIQQGALNINNVAQFGIPSGQAVSSGGNAPGFVVNIPTPGGATVATSDGQNLYVAGQQVQPDGLLAGNLTTIALGSDAVTGTYSISDGTHTKLLFADDNTLWIGSQYCATGERQKKASQGDTSQAANYNCLTRFDLSAKTASIVPAVNQNTGTQVAYPNTNLNYFYYGDLTGICWVQTFHKVYTAYGGQVHVFSTTDGSEIDNSLVTVQGTALDVAYMDAATNFDN
ncbi:MAG TPA: hypothetical protein VGC07_06390 [Granulicella sp.]